MLKPPSPCAWARELELVDEIYPLCSGFLLALKVGVSLLARCTFGRIGRARRYRKKHGIPWANVDGIQDILEMSFKNLQSHSQEAFFDIAAFLCG